jgi:hypothetical protein
MRVFGEAAAKDWPGNAGYRPHGGDVGDIAGPLARRHNVADDGLRQRNQPAAADTLHAAAKNHHAHVGRKRADDRAQHKYGNAGKQHRPAAVNIRQLAIERRHGGGCQEIAGDKPGKIHVVIKRGTNVGDGWCDDILVERGEQHGGQHTDDDFAYVFGVERRGIGRLHQAVWARSVILARSVMMTFRSKAFGV